MRSLFRILFVVAAIVMFGARADALVVCAKDNGSGQPKPKSKLTLETACTPGKQVEIGIAVTGTVGVDSTVAVYGSNLQVVDGSGSTEGATNGLGNVVVGYNETITPHVRTGSHNIIVGTENDYTSFGGIVAGTQNTISGPYSTVTGGIHNTASGEYSSVGGGFHNEASGPDASVSGGIDNLASGLDSSVSGGAANLASQTRSSICGGASNTASGLSSAVSGGSSNVASGDFSSVSGGQGNVSSGNHEWHSWRSNGFPTAIQY